LVFYVLSSVLRNEDHHEKEKVGPFLENHGLSLLEDLDSHQLEDRYFKDSGGKIISSVNGTHCLVRAVKV
jgi:hypothetical protein